MLPILEEDGALRQLSDEKAKNQNLMKIIWAIVRKQGGEIRLTDIERGVLCDDWRLLQYADLETGQLVIKANEVPSSK